MSMSLWCRMIWSRAWLQIYSTAALDPFFFNAKPSQTPTHDVTSSYESKLKSVKKNQPHWNKCLQNLKFNNILLLCQTKPVRKSRIESNAPYLRFKYLAREWDRKWWYYEAIKALKWGHRTKRMTDFYRQIGRGLFRINVTLAAKPPVLVLCCIRFILGNQSL